MTGEQDTAREPATIRTIEELMAHAHAMEVEAAERYRELAEVMEQHNNPEVAALFRKLERYEGVHAGEIAERAAGMELPAYDPWSFKWSDAESPELVDTLSMHYLMSPWMALTQAQEAERRACAFFSDLAAATSDPALSKLARRFAAEEQEHIRLIGELLQTLERPREDWNEDLDPPVALE